MNIYPIVEPIVIFNSFTSTAGVYKVCHKTYSQYLLYIEDFAKENIHHTNFYRLATALTALKNYKLAVEGFSYYTFYNTDEIVIEELLDLLSES